jgi:SCP1.201-like deaminase
MTDRYQVTKGIFRARSPPWLTGWRRKEKLVAEESGEAESSEPNRKDRDPKTVRHAAWEYYRNAQRNLYELDHPGKRPDRFDPEVWDRLEPKDSPIGQPAKGIAVGTDGSGRQVAVEFVSSSREDPQAWLRGERLWKMCRESGDDHEGLPPGGKYERDVEGQVAAMMRLTNSQREALYINKRPCYLCDAALPRMLSAGARLTVYYPDGCEVYEGLSQAERAKEPWKWPSRPEP